MVEEWSWVRPFGVVVPYASAGKMCILYDISIIACGLGLSILGKNRRSLLDLPDILMMARRAHQITSEGWRSPFATRLDFDLESHGHDLSRDISPAPCCAEKMRKPHEGDFGASQQNAFRRHSPGSCTMHTKT